MPETFYRLIEGHVIGNVQLPCSLLTTVAYEVLSSKHALERVSIFVRWGDTDDPHKMHKLRHLADINKPLQEAAREKGAKYQSDYANDRRISFMPAAFSTSGHIDAEFLQFAAYNQCAQTHKRSSTFAHHQR